MSQPEATEDLEHERRFLVADTSILDREQFDVIGQAYFFARGGWAIRVRRTFYRASAYRKEDTPPEGPIMLTIKGPRENLGRREYEWELPRAMALDLFPLSDMKVFKERYSIIDSESKTPWVIDVFRLDSEGLIIAECEMHDLEELRSLSPPAWCGAEVTGDPRYNNEELARHPWKIWDYIYRDLG